MLDAIYLILNAKSWFSYAWCLDAKYWMLSPRSRMLNAECWRRRPAPRPAARLTVPGSLECHLEQPSPSSPRQGTSHSRLFLLLDPLPCDMHPTPFFSTFPLPPLFRFPNPLSTVSNAYLSHYSFSFCASPRSLPFFPPFTVFLRI